MKNKRLLYVAFGLALVMLICGLSACQKGNSQPSDAPTVSPTVSPTDTPTATPAETPTVSPTATPAETPTETPPETILWPVLDGFHRTDGADEPMTAIYEADDDPYMGFQVMSSSANAEQLDAFRLGWSAETEDFLAEKLPGSIASHDTVNLPGLNRQGLHLELDLGVQDDPDPLIMQVLFFTSNDQLIQVSALSKLSGKDILQAAWQQFIAQIQVK